MKQADIPHKDLLTEIDRFCEDTGMTRSAFGIKAMRDPRFVFDLASGRECRRATVQKARRFLLNNAVPEPGIAQ